MITSITVGSIFLNVADGVYVSEENIDNQEIADSGSLFEQINVDGFGSRYNLAPRGIEIFDGCLVIGTANYNNDSSFVLGRSYSVRDFFYMNHMHDLGGRDWFSDGCEIWCFNDSTGWNQIVGGNEEAIMPVGFGNKNNVEVGLLIGYKGYLYAGLKSHRMGCQIWRTKNLDEEWEMVVGEGFGDKNNYWCTVAEVFNGELYVCTANYGNGSEIFRTSDGENWNAVVGDDSCTKNGFGERRNFAWSMCVYDSCLYVGTLNLYGGCELWKSSDGVNWEPVVAYVTWLEARLHGADFPRGFARGNTHWVTRLRNRNWRGGIRRMVVYNEELYVGVTGEDFCMDITLGGFGKLFSIPYGLFSFRPIKQLSSLGCEIWKYNASCDKWTKVVGGIFRGNASSGFGDRRNEYPWSMIVYDDHIYVGTMRVDPFDVVFTRNDFLNWSICFNIFEGGCQLWRFDGDCWEKVNEDGFGDKYNVGFREMIVYNDSIIGGTMNINTGCEVWRYNLV